MTNTSTLSVTFEKRGAVALVTLNRPQALNSFTRQMHHDLWAAFDQAGANPEIRAMVLTGAGRGFCAGADLSEFDFTPGPDMVKRADPGPVLDQAFNPTTRRIQALRMPVVAAVNGVAAGAGASIAMACDIAIASPQASFIQAFSKIGLIPDAGSSWLLVERLGLPRALALAMTGDKLMAEQAKSWGMIWDVADDPHLAIGLPQVSANSGFNNFLNLPVQVVSAKFLNPNANEGEVVSFKGGTDYSLLGNIQVNQLLFNGSYFVALSASRVLIEMQKTLDLQTKEDVVFNVSQAYHLAAVAKENLIFVDSMLLLSEKLLEKQKSFFEVGVITQEEVDQMNYAVLSAKNAHESSKLQYNNALAILKLAMFLPLEQEISLTETTSDLLKKSLLAEGGFITDNFNLKILEKQILLDKLDLKNKKMAFLPILKAQFQHSYVAYRNELNFFANQSWYPQTSWGIQFSIPIYSSGSGRAIISQSKIKLMQDQNTLKITEQALKMQEIQASNNFIGAKQKLALQKENIELAGKIYANTLLKEKIGKESSIVVTQKYNQLMIAQSQYIGSMVELFQSKITLDKLYNQILTTK